MTKDELIGPWDYRQTIHSSNHQFVPTFVRHHYISGYIETFWLQTLPLIEISIEMF